MFPLPTGRIEPTATGRDLILTRTFSAPIEDVWDSITVSERTARWFGPWTGEPGEGNTIRYRMVMEEGEPEGELTIERCRPPDHLAVTTSDGAGSWRLEARLVEQDGVTELTFIHHLDPEAPAGEIGPGWEYYLDQLVASRDDAPRRPFDDYYPAQRDHYLAFG